MIDEIFTLENPSDLENKGFICLKYTCQITEDMKVKPIYKWLDKEYGKVKSSVGKAICSILNSILFQERIVFVMTRKETQDLMFHDKNYKKSERQGFRNELWKVIIAKMVDAKYIQFLHYGANTDPNVFEVIHPELLKIIQGKGREEQITETIRFLQKQRDRKPDISSKSGTGMGTEMGTQGHRTTEP